MDDEKIESAKYIVLGNVDAGKSSFIGVMEKNILDDGNGKARNSITTLQHEKETGRTSAHSFHYIIKNNEITTLVDLCGHEKYLKTTIFGVTGLFADYGIVIIGANMGLCGMTREHLALLMANKIPFIIIITKIDICPPNVLENLKKDLSKILKKEKKELINFEEEEIEINGSYIKDSHQGIIDALQNNKTTIIPAIMISNKTGHNINFVRELLCSIRSRYYLEKKNIIETYLNPKTLDYPAVMYVDNTFNVMGIGIVLSGTVKYGDMKMGQKIFIGPINNNYIGATVKSIHNCISENVQILKENESGSIGIRLDSKGTFSKEMFSKGQVVCTDLNFAMKNTCYSFNCEVYIFNHPTTIRDGYQTIIHCGTIRQTGKFKISDNKILRTNSKDRIDIKFTQRPEFILAGTYFMFRDGRTKGIGVVRSCTPFTEDFLDPIPRRKNIRWRRR